MTDPRPRILSIPWEFARLGETDIAPGNQTTRITLVLPDGGEIEIRGTPDVSAIARAVSAVPEMLDALIQQRDAVDRWTRTGRPLSPKETRILHARNRDVIARAIGSPMQEVRR